MDNKKAIDLLSMIEFKYAECCLNTWYKGIDDDMKEALKMAIKALEQEPCYDCISRQAAIDCVTYDEEYTVKCLKELPPVTPPTNIGWWIDEKVDGGHKVYCSKCNGSAVFEYVNDGDIYSSYGHGVVKKTKYCPNCGTKMLEVEE